MIQYALTNTCKSAFIADYFNAAKENTCGKCSSCKNNSIAPLSATDLKNGIEWIQQVLEKGAKSIPQLAEEIKLEEKTLNELLAFMKQEEMIEVNLDGKISLK